MVMDSFDLLLSMGPLNKLAPWPLNKMKKEEEGVWGGVVMPTQHLISFMEMLVLIVTS